MGHHGRHVDFQRGGLRQDGHRNVDVRRSWTNNSTSANWSAGTRTVIFNSTTSQTMAFTALAGDGVLCCHLGSTAASGAVISRWPRTASGGTIPHDSRHGGIDDDARTANLSRSGGSIVAGDRDSRRECLVRHVVDHGR